jgi:hypothetical protein
MASAIFGEAMYHCERRLLPTLFSIATACAIGCDDGQSAPIQPLPEAQAVQFNSGLTTKQRLVVSDGAAWATLWNEIASPFQPVPAVPVVDFAENVLIVGSMGRKATGGYSISIDEVRLVDGAARVSVTEESPGSGCSVTESLTAPVDIVITPRFAGQATFVEHTSQGACR